MNSVDQNNTRVKHYTLKECKELATKINNSLPESHSVDIPETNHPWDTLYLLLRKYHRRIEIALRIISVRDSQVHDNMGTIERLNSEIELKESLISNLKQKVNQLEADAPMKNLLFEYTPDKALNSIGLIMDVLIEVEGKEEVHWTEEFRLLRTIQDEFITLQGK